MLEVVGEADQFAGLITWSKLGRITDAPGRGDSMKAWGISGKIGLGAFVAATVLPFQTGTAAQWNSREGWVEEPAAKSLNEEGDSGHAYLDPASVHRGDDGLMYFNESSNVRRPGEIGNVGLMKDAYDCQKNIKYVCVEHGNWRNDRKSTIDATNDPALPVYRRYLCGDRGTP
jgi:hypothetical protein